MGAWGTSAFDNDTANDWANDLEQVNDLSLVESTLAEIERTGANYLDLDPASNALAAAEVLARLQGRAGFTTAFPLKVDEWVSAHPLGVTRALVDRASAAIDPVLGDRSELRELWDETPDADERRAGLEDLRRRVAG